MNKKEIFNMPTHLLALFLDNIQLKPCLGRWPKGSRPSRTPKDGPSKWAAEPVACFFLWGSGGGGEFFFLAVHDKTI